MYFLVSYDLKTNSDDNWEKKVRLLQNQGNFFAVQFTFQFFELFYHSG